ncbi:MAG: hypothetical protein KDJ38_11600 [Gammaproteobacteria bacterium]|nr:hypothetical protein [Gammaproteobacteria bacterium]
MDKNNKKKIVLHIGRHKSGTTSIQQFLHTNPEWLGRFGYYYPTIGKRAYAHHELGERFSRQSLRSAGPEYLLKNDEYAKSLIAEIDATDKSIIISSEAFQNCDPSVIKKLFDKYDVRIVIYLRNQVSYLPSAYAQKIHATDYAGTMEQFYQDIFDIDYHRFLSNWERQFPGKLTVRIFDRNTLIANDVVMDFLQSVLDIDTSDNTIPVTGQDANPTLTSRLLAYKLYINTTYGDSLNQAFRRDLYRELGALSRTDDSARVLPSAALAEQVIRDSEESNRLTAREYFDRSDLFNNDSLSFGEAYQITRQEIDKISGLLINQAPGLQALFQEPAKLRS